MQIKVLTETPERTIAAVFDPAEEAADGLLQIAVEQNLTAARLTGIGALSPWCSVISISRNASIVTSK